MIKTFSRCGIKIILSTMLASASVSAAAQAQLPRAEVSTTVDQRVADIEDFVDGAMAMAIANRELAGAVFVLVKDGEIVFQNGYGFADVETRRPVDPARTLFRPGSVSKLFTWTAIMQLVEQGRLNLDDPVDRYLDFSIPDTFPQDITVRHLLDHSAGFEDGYKDMFVSSPDEYQALGPWLAGHIPARVREPGTEVSYSNYSTALAGYIVQRISGEDFSDYVDRHIFQPAGMTRSTFREPLPEAWEQDVAVGYEWQDGRFEAQPAEMIYNIAPAGSLSSTGTDMARFMIAHLQDGRIGDQRILRPETARQMRERLAANSPGLPGIAHGFLESRASNPRIVGHGGNTGEFHSNLLLVPEENLGFYISVTGGNAASTARSEISALVLDRLFPTERLPKWQGAPAELAEGTYRTNRRSYTNHRVDPSSLIQVSRDGEHGIQVTIADQTIRWEQVGPRLFQQVTGETTPYGPLGLIQFYGEGDDTRFSFEAQPYTLYRLVS
ncbi:serine hydrolase [Altererythrobacter sp. SALINAS58]|uniref:serine hydrolase domain-containing protein n=1 Tax=Alteripontixanthobacter muriae TaxID=2705546 RepID=UPI0015750A6F|nr:serine hydrolase domain-containing protein [Alteripontixanthobacter muriae]NTZ43278.1 serine hydrolase [Alteripontixanthobacter muriae]